VWRSNLLHVVGILRIFFLFVEVVGHVLDLLRGLEELLVARVCFARFSHQRCSITTSERERVRMCDKDGSDAMGGEEYR
jgi:uncharacterized membrane protein YbaN (DUF454 family)